MSINESSIVYKMGHIFTIKHNIQSPYSTTVGFRKVGTLHQEEHSLEQKIKMQGHFGQTFADVTYMT